MKCDIVCGKETTPVLIAYCFMVGMKMSQLLEKEPILKRTHQGA